MLEAERENASVAVGYRGAILGMWAREAGATYLDMRATHLDMRAKIPSRKVTLLKL